MIPVHHLAGLAEVAALLGVSRQRVYQLIAAYPDFPEPIAHLSATKVWAVEDIEAWRVAHADRGPASRPSRGAAGR